MKKIYLLMLIGLLTSYSHSAELFIRVLRQGSHVSTAYNQTQTNSTNIFRFFELPGGTTTIQITDQQSGMSVYTGSVNMNYNQRIVAELDQMGVFKIIQTINIITTNWYTSSPETIVYNPNQGNGFPGNGYPNGGYGNYGNGSNDPAFQQFLTMLENESFDSKRLDQSKSYADKTQLSAQQIADINKKFSFDSYRLEWAKYAYAKCYDKANYFLLKSTFDFTSNYSALEDYIEGQ